ncbi:hypothetical protein [Nicoliella lavandulae]|uniref:DUF5689 domain-containing protein n=1 Tax=Nicoliella lavandulae TaxID=3082954 RepID=A0ABU8SIJ9_9LACO
MGIVLNNLKVAAKKNQIVNVYRMDEIFFTGYVYKLDDVDEQLVLRTYDEWGMPDGMVYLDLTTVYDVEVNDSPDLKHMKRRIDLAELYQFDEIAETDLMPLNKLANLRLEILGRSYVDGQVVMITTYDGNGIAGNYKCVINSVNSEVVNITTVNKMDFADHQTRSIALSDIVTIEFLGKELTLLTKNRSLLFGPSLATQQISGGDLSVPAILDHSKKHHQLIEVESAADNGYYYIGYVVNYNSEFIIFNLVNMSGQFGGYVLLRTSMVASLFTQSDYLTLINHLVAENKAAHTFVEPVLNADREFDMTDNALLALLRQAIKLNRLVRIAQPKTHGMLGYPLEITPITNQLVFQEVDDSREGLEKPVEIHLSNIGELSFGYLEAFFIDDGLKNQREL